MSRDSFFASLLGSPAHLDVIFANKGNDGRSSIEGLLFFRASALRFLMFTIILNIYDIVNRDRRTFFVYLAYSLVEHDKHFK